MGILKHAILPGFALIHAGAFYACKDLETFSKLIGLRTKSEGDIAASEGKETDAEVAQKHMLGSLRGFHLTMMALCTVGFLKESAHFRKEIVLGECLLCGAISFDAFRLRQHGLRWHIPGLQAVVAAIGAVINSMEPGIFTKDKTKA